MTEMTDKFECLVQGMLDDEYGIVEDFISPALVVGLRNNLLARLDAGKMLQAGIGQHASFQENNAVRRDQISWIEDDQSDSSEKEYFRLLWDLVGYLNLTCYTGLNAFESHYAHYGPGSFYKKHTDTFKNNPSRKFSMISYLNEDWKEADGGQLMVYQNYNNQKIAPEQGTTVFFKSNELQHEVLVTQQQRMSITGWLKRDH